MPRLLLLHVLRCIGGCLLLVDPLPPPRPCPAPPPAARSVARVGQPAGPRCAWLYGHPTARHVRGSRRSTAGRAGLHCHRPPPSRLRGALPGVGCKLGRRGGQQRAQRRAGRWPATSAGHAARSLGWRSQGPLPELPRPLGERQPPVLLPAPCLPCRRSCWSSACGLACGCCATTRCRPRSRTTASACAASLPSCSGSAGGRAGAVGALRGHIQANGWRVCMPCMLRAPLRHPPVVLPCLLRCACCAVQGLAVCRGYHHPGRLCQCHGPVLRMGPAGARRVREEAGSKRRRRPRQPGPGRPEGGRADVVPCAPSLAGPPA